MVRDGEGGRRSSVSARDWDLDLSVDIGLLVEESLAESLFFTCAFGYQFRFVGKGMGQQILLESN